MAKSKRSDVSIGKFDILATFTYAKALLDGLPEPEAKERVVVAAIMGARAKLGHANDHKSEKEAAEKKKKSSITSETFDRQVADKMGSFFEDVFVPALKKLAAAGLSYDEVKRLVEVPSTWGAKITGEQFRERVAGTRRRRAPRGDA
jgi:hypothetical protein